MHQMQGSQASVTSARAAQGFAINGHLTQAKGFAGALDPTEQTRLQDRGIQAIEESFEGVVRGNVAGQGEKSFEPIVSLFGKGRDLRPIIRAADNRTAHRLKSM